MTLEQRAFVSAEAPDPDNVCILWAIDLGLVERPTHKHKHWRWTPHTELLRQGARTLVRLSVEGNTETWSADFEGGAWINFRRTLHTVHVIRFTAHSMDEARALMVWVKAMGLAKLEEVS